MKGHDLKQLASAIGLTESGEDLVLLVVTAHHVICLTDGETASQFKFIRAAAAIWYD